MGLHRLADNSSDVRLLRSNGSPTSTAKRANRSAPAALKARRGNVLIYSVFAVIGMVGIGSFAVDYGRREAVRSELQFAADAAARAAIFGLSDNTAVSKAIAIAAQNVADNSAVTITSSDVTVGTYDTSTGLFSAGGASPNAVKVVASRTGTNGVATTLLGLIGGPQRVNVRVTSYAVANTAYQAIGAALYTPPTTHGIVGLNWFNLNSSTVESWDYSTNTVGGGVMGGTNAGVNINSSTFSGTLYKQSSQSISNNGSTITSTASLSSPYSFTAPTTPSTGVTNMGNYNGPPLWSQTLPGGKYYFDSFNVPLGKTLTFSGPAELYINGSCSISGNINTYGNLPTNTKIRMVSGSGVDIGMGATPLYLDVYAPNSPLNVSGRRVYGMFVMGGINLSGARISVDRTLGATTAGTWTAAPSGYSTGTATATQAVSVMPR
jgi:Flp pilus assembly protein TadG